MPGTGFLIPIPTELDSRHNDSGGTSLRSLAIGCLSCDLSPGI